MKSAFKRFGLTGHDITFIKVGIRNIFIKIKFCRHQECIWGEPLPSETELVGRGENKKFMYQLVNNKKNGIDVDKVDNVGKSHNFLFYFFLLLFISSLYSVRLPDQGRHNSWPWNRKV